MKSKLFFLILLLCVSCVDEKQLRLSANLGHGMELYETHCANCHQMDGKGLAKLIPPLLDADYIRNQTDSISSIIRNGLNGPVKVNGTIYNLQMPGNKTLTDEEIELIASYVITIFNNKSSSVAGEN